MNDPFLPEELRLFIACELPDTWRQTLERASRDLSRAGLGDLRWARPEGVHLTLKFLGDVGRHLLPDLGEAVRRACTGRLPFELRLSQLGTFGGHGRVRVLWAGVEGDLEALRRLQSAVDAELGLLGFARETRPFSPHLTLARAQDSAPADTGARITRALRAAPALDSETWVVGELSLMRSQLGRGGAVYSRLAGAPIGPGTANE
jgi:2'-5' RNA ligase